MSEVSIPPPEKQEVHCSGCSRLVKLPADAGSGSLVTCPFCHTRMTIRVMSVYVGEPVVEA